MADQTLTLILTGADAERLARLMKSGNYTSAEDAVSEALAALEDAAGPVLDAWLQEVVANRVDAHDAGPARGIPLDEARRRVLGAG
jgi:Arc/MetJ-type ribon-helix-helix transcriptional regulator